MCTQTGNLLKTLKETYPGAKCELDFSNPLQMLIATILSAQCTDKRVNQITPALFKRYHSAKDFAEASLEELEDLIRTAGFYHNKAKNIKSCCQVLCEKFKGTVPDTLTELVQLPGVGRKTANVVLSNSFNKNEGIAVDTHVQRLSKRLKLSLEATPEAIEQELMKLVPQSEWGQLSHALILHGRRCCTARCPKCMECALEKFCPKNGVYS